MADTRFDRDPAANASRRVAGESPPRAPRWAKVLAALALLLVLAFVVVLVVGGSGGHGPGRHSSDGVTASGPTSPPAASDGGRSSPAGAAHVERQR